MVGTGRLREIDHVLRHDVGHEHVLEGLLHREDFFARDDRAYPDLVLAPLAAALEDLPLLVRARISDRYANQKAVELRIGERIRALELDRVLRRDDQERRLEPEGLPFHRHLRLLHRLQQRGLGLGGRPVDLVGQQEVGEDGTRTKLEASLALIEQEAPGDVRGKEIGRALKALERQAERLGEEPRDQRLGEARIVLDQDVAARENPGEDALEHVALADDHARERAQDLAASLGDPVDLHRRVSSDATRRASTATDGPRPNRRPGGFASVSGERPRASATSRGHSRWSKYDWLRVLNLISSR